MQIVSGYPALDTQQGLLKEAVFDAFHLQNTYQDMPIVLGNLCPTCNRVGRRQRAALPLARALYRGAASVARKRTWHILNFFCTRIGGCAWEQNQTGSGYVFS